MDPPEDAGAVTHARYRYQWEVGARTCIASLTEESIAGLLCEWHEDHVVAFGDGAAELVSVKHREASQGPWTLRGLCVDGGVAHLYQRWIGLSRIPRCRVFTSGGLNSDDQDSRAFADACHSRDEREIRPFARQIQRHLGAADAEDVVAFCQVLSIEAAQPGRPFIEATNIQDLLLPALRAMHVTATDPRRVYEAIVGLVERASRDREDRVSLGSVADVHRLDKDVARAALLASRFVTRSQVRAAVLEAIRPGGIRLAPSEPIPTRTNLQVKLERGGVGPTSIRSAQRTRALWAEVEARFRGDYPGADVEIEDLRTRVLEAVSAVEDDVLGDTHPTPYGPTLLSRVRSALRIEAIAPAAVFPIEDLHLLGLAFQLTDECQVWWSEEFDLRATV